MPDIEAKEFFTPENKDFINSAELNTKDVDEMFKRASLICDEERKFEERKESFIFESKENAKEPEEKSFDEKTSDKLGKYSENLSPELINKKGQNFEQKESPKLEQNQEKKEEVFKEKEEEVKTGEVQIETFIPANISKGLEEVLNFLKETCPLKYVF